jgi:hypothetical protein
MRISGCDMRTCPFFPGLRTCPNLLVRSCRSDLSSFPKGEDLSGFPKGEDLSVLPKAEDLSEFACLFVPLGLVRFSQG